MISGLNSFVGVVLRHSLDIRLNSFVFAIDFVINKFLPKFQECLKNVLRTFFRMNRNFIRLPEVNAMQHLTCL